jgi:hypothetical protein
MVTAAWIAAWVCVIVYFGSWVLQIALWALPISIRLLIGVAGLLLGLACLLGLALFDRPGLRKALAALVPDR